MSRPDSAVPARVSSSKERQVVWVFCLLAAIHVFVYCAAFPLFNNADEPSHFDLVVRYAHGAPPRSFGPMADEWMEYDAAYGTPEYFNPPEMFPGGQPPPPLWSQPSETVAQTLAERKAQWQGINHESSQPPLYYALAGLWWQLGRVCGL